MMSWLAQLTSLAQQATAHIGPQVAIALFLVALLTEVGIPFPGVMDSVLFLAGYQLVHPWVPAILLPALLMVGRESGSTLVFWVARAAGRPIKKRLGPQFSLQTAGQSLADGGRKGVVAALLARLGSQLSRASGLNLASTLPAAIMLGRITPGLLTACSVACGIIDVRYPYFIAGIAMSSLFADGALIAMGAAARAMSTFFGITVPLIWLVVIAIVVNILLILLLGRWLLKRRKA